MLGRFFYSCIPVTASILTFAGGDRNVYDQKSLDLKCLSFLLDLLVSVLNWSHGIHFDIIFMHISTFTVRSLSLSGKLLFWSHGDHFDMILMHF